MSPEKKTKSDNKNKCDENSPFDIFDSEYSTGGDSNENDDSFFVPNLTSNTVVNLNSSSTVLNDYDEDDEEDFISKYLISIYSQNITYKRNSCLNTLFLIYDLSPCLNKHYRNLFRLWYRTETIRSTIQLAFKNQSS